jgi:hypothetical protein
MHKCNVARGVVGAGGGARKGVAAGVVWVGRPQRHQASWLGWEQQVVGLGARWMRSRGCCRVNFGIACMLPDHHAMPLKVGTSYSVHFIASHPIPHPAVCSVFLVPWGRPPSQTYVCVLFASTAANHCTSCVAPHTLILLESISSPASASGGRRVHVSP